MLIKYLFRSKELHAFSVEKLFTSIIPIISNEYEVSEHYMPEYRINLKNIYLNIRSAQKTVKGSPKNTIFHITGDIYYVAIGLPRERTVLTVLDTVALKKTRGLKRSILKLLWFTIPISISKYITVISEETKNELVNLYPWCERKISVVPCPVDDSFEKSEKPFNDTKPNILQVGTKDNKNLRRVIDALEGIRCCFHIVGSITDKEIELMHDKGIEYINYYRISDEEMIEAYKNCDILVFASTYEGFGMPIIEAQASGKVVVTSNIEPMKSVSGNAAYLVDPYDSSDIHRAILSAINNDEERERLIESGLQNCNRFKPTTVAGQYCKVYKQIENNIRR